MTDSLLRRASTGTDFDYENNVQMIRRNLSPGTVIEFHCYNELEVEETKKRLTEDERKQVRFFWMVFNAAK